ncbi:MAG: ABC transporter permease [Thermoanaerobaculaceae bacterium]
MPRFMSLSSLRTIGHLALRGLAASPRTVFLTVTGVGLGVAVFIFTVGLMDGLLIYFSQRILKISPTLTVLPENLTGGEMQKRLWSSRPTLVHVTRMPVPDDRQTIRGAPALAEKLRRLPGVEGASLFVTTASVLSYGAIQEGSTMHGLDPNQEPRVTELHKYLSQGNWEDLKTVPNGAILGFRLANRLGVALGNRLLALGENGSVRELQVTGILAVGLGSWDESTTIVNVPMAQALAGWGADEAAEIRLRTSLENLEQLRQQVQDLTGRRVERWEETNSAALRLFRTIGVTTYLLTGFVLIVAGLGIANKLATLILDKEKDIAILRAYGFTALSIRGVFLLQGLLLGVLGVLAGCAVAFVGISYFQAFPIRFPTSSGAPLAYTELFVSNRASYYFAIGTLALVIATLASLLAVRRAVKVMPVEVLRGQT